MIELRKQHDWVIYGDFKLIDSEADVFAYLRTYKGKKYLVVANLSDEENQFKVSLPDKYIVFEIKYFASQEDFDEFRSLFN